MFTTRVHNIRKFYKDIVRGPTPFVVRYKKYCINGFLFITKEHESSRRYQSSGICRDSMTTFCSSSKDKSLADEATIYYGVLKDIIRLEYYEGYKPVLFKCDWVKVTQNGIRVDEESNLRMVNLSNIIRFNLLDDGPFILVEHARQVFYSKDPKDHNWHIVLDVPLKIYVKDEP